MDDDQQFCLRWNNHQSTLISVFDTLLENETLVDCTLAAEGKFLKAHKVVLSACSPYFATLLSEQYDKHPIFILKDVKYQELRAMMDYMYRGEVNISQDQLAALLKAAESLQIKGLSDNRTGSGNSSSGLGGVSQQQQQQKISAEQQHKHISVPGKLMTGSASAGYTLEQTKRSRIGPSSIDSQDLSGSREGSSSPTSRRRKKVRRRSIENVLADNHDNSNSSQVIQGGSSSIVPTTNATGTITAMLPMIGSGVGGTTTTISSSVASTITVAAQQQLQQQQQQASAATAAANIITANVTKKTESVKMGGNTDAMNAAVTAVDNIQDENAADSIDEKEMIMKEKQNHKRPKHQHEGVVATSTGKDEIVIEPKSEYDDEGNDETVEDLTLDDEEMGLEDLDHNAGPSHGGEGSSQGYAQWQVDRSQDEVFMAAQEAQQRDPQDMTIDFEQSMTVGDRFPCSVCGKSYLRKRHLQRHMRDECIGIPPRFKCDLCPSRFRRKYHMVRHMTSKHGIPANDGPENLSMKKDFYENENVPGPGYSVIHHNAAAAAAAAVAAVAAAQAGGNLKYECGVNNGGGAVVPPTSTIPSTMPSYGLTGAIAAYPTSASAAAVAAATAAALSGSDDDQHYHQNNHRKDDQDKEETEPKMLKVEPISPSKGIAMDEDWKMKLSLQLISNSLLKERLMNSMPFAYNNN
ncbi:longitudinals lacking protein, isoforms H/M/V isoform X7 [Eupeodes corollae]|uniref:longitudinals lacking protein, isoforms H/M/V isoform X7 n=1 Tax=Eupeodes corollae TaxID=290404 RepID=UPI00248F77C2|nr:longitudinals lacking protein, isoforms H/M/V isoform X7 [Eupeodes corollae]